MGEKLRAQGNSVVFARPDGADYEVIQKLEAADFIPLGIKLTEKERTYTVDSVDYSTGRVSLRDDTFAGGTGFPIFRSEPIAFVREWVKDTQEQELLAPVMEVTSDIIFLQKRETPPQYLPDWVEAGQTADGVPVNKYFEQHPEMVLGTMAWETGMYGQETSCVPLPEADLKEQLAEAITHLNAPDRAALLQFVPEQDTPTVEEVPAELRNFSYTQVGGKLFYNENDNLTPVEVPATTAERIRGMIGLRDITRDLIEAQLNGGSEDTITDLQQKLNTAYDSFQAKYGLINSTGNKRAFEQDSSYCLLCSLEVLDEDGKLERNYLTEHGITEYTVLLERAETMASDFESVSTSIKQMEHRMEQIAALKTHIINYAKTRDTYAAYRRTKAADKPAFRTAHEADLLLHEAAKRAFDAQGVKKLPTVKVLQAEYTELLTKKKAAYEDYKRLRKENQELQAVKSNVDTLLRIEEEPQEKKQEQHR